jgi:lysozyme
MTTTPPGESSAPGNTPIKQFLSAEALKFIERHEGYSGKVYNDVAGNPTIGYGHLIQPGEDFSGGITRTQAMLLLSKDTGAAVDSVNNKIIASLLQTQFDALVDFTFNLGGAAFGRSVLLRNVNSGQIITLGNFADWDHAGGEVVPGLLKRRTDEFNLYTTGDYGPINVA